MERMRDFLGKRSNNEACETLTVLVKASEAKFVATKSGGYCEKVTPVPIPNTVVKLLRAENTWWATARKHKSPPEL